MVWIGPIQLSIAELLDRSTAAAANRTPRDRSGLGWIGGLCFSGVKSLMTHRIVLEGAAGEHLRQELTTTEDLLGIMIAVKCSFRHRQVRRTHRLSSFDKFVGPGLNVVELVLQQLKSTRVRGRRCCCGGQCNIVGGSILVSDNGVSCHGI